MDITDRNVSFRWSDDPLFTGGYVRGSRGSIAEVGQGRTEWPELKVRLMLIDRSWDRTASLGSIPNLKVVLFHYRTRGRLPAAPLHAYTTSRYLYSTFESRARSAAGPSPCYITRHLSAAQVHTLQTQPLTTSSTYLGVVYVLSCSCTTPTLPKTPLARPRLRVPTFSGTTTSRSGQTSRCRGPPRNTRSEPTSARREEQTAASRPECNRRSWRPKSTRRGRGRASLSPRRLS